MATKPTNLAEWATGGGAQITEPTLGEKQDGWAPAQEPPAEWFNWWQNLVHLWVLWLDAFESEAHTWSAAQTFSASTLFNGAALFADDAVFQGNAEFDAGAIFLDDVEIDAGKSIFSSGALRVTSLGNTGGGGFDAAGELHLKSGAAGLGSIILKAKKILFEGTATNTDALRIDLGESAGPDRCRFYVINGTVWLLYNATYDDGTQQFARVDNAKNSTAIVVGQDNDFGLQYPVKIFIRNLEDASPWAPAAWRTTGQGSASSAGNGAIARETPITPTLLNNYINDNFTPSVGPVEYWKDPIGVVHFQGAIRLGSGSSGNPAFNLPQAYRPAYRRWLEGLNTPGGVGLYVDANGDVVLIGTSGSTYQLDGLSFSG